VIDAFLASSDPVFGIIHEALEGGDVLARLRGEVLHAGFKRLT
jgi:hypothetical protein